MVKAAGANVPVDGGEGYYDRRADAWWDKLVHKFGKRSS